RPDLSGRPRRGGPAGGHPRRLPRRRDAVRRARAAVQRSGRARPRQLRAPDRVRRWPTRPAARGLEPRTAPAAQSPPPPRPRSPAGSDVSTIRYESPQPPLYYLLMAPLALATGQAPEAAQVVALRLGSVAIGLVALVALYLAARGLIACDRATALLALALAAF